MTAAAPPWNIWLFASTACADASGQQMDFAAEAETAASVYHDAQRFLELYHAYYNRILNYLYRRTADRELALDLTSQVFTSAFEALRRKEHRKLRLRPWLYRLATNAHLDHCRAARRWNLRLPVLGWHFTNQHRSLPDERLIQLSDAEAIRLALLRLPEASRAPMILRYYEEMSYAEISQVLQIRETSARSRVKRGLDQLKRQLEGGQA